ncbi:uncharacterized protein BDR25DRAFT_285781 [Lindgomyces ingoldianus]|uniref:Uncharacterized protein n=1 Tax=Lindgomyces ingoldianus TaxID=673940 RepID=A0ACB6QW92_9PLEO|nr:uncharacterized protein BDR25DRAFT_285781 [Lindgomyces ingoldianus]KAF2471288.1 hypothetical protein BDR25DRAFT_285781 [Lindgomyces ingoldianus]
MRFALFSLLLALLAAFAMAVAPQKSVVISYPKDTPQSVVDQAMDAIREAGGQITHTYSKGFACNAPAAVLEQVQAWGSEYNALIEEDQVVTTNNKE